MLLRAATTIRNQNAMGAIPANIENCLFACYPELIGAKLSYRPDEEIYGEAEEAEFVYKVLTGAVRTYRLLNDGRRQIGAFHLPDDLFGFESSSTHKVTAEAITDTVLLVFKRGSIEHFASRDIEMARQLWSLTASSLDHAMEQMLLLGRKTAAEKVATFLLEMDTRMRPTGGISLPMSRRDIADYLGLTLETVSRTISQLQAEGMVTLSSAREIRVQRPSKLRELGSEDGYQ
jgi:CRP/FNR family nitrogen fixation transcriptional regulator